MINKIATPCMYNFHLLSQCARGYFLSFFFNFSLWLDTQGKTNIKYDVMKLVGAFNIHPRTGKYRNVNSETKNNGIVFLCCLFL